MKKTKVEAYDELVEGIDRGYFLYMSGVGPYGDGEAQVIGYEINEDAHPGKEDLEEEGFADEDEWWRAYRGQEAVVIDRPMGQGGSNFRILDSLDVGKDFDIYYYGNGYEESPQKKDPVHWHKDRNEVLSAMYERKIDLNNLFERVMNGAATLKEGGYSPRGLSYASQPSERELALKAEFDTKFTIEFNGELVEVMPLGKGRALIKQTDSGIQDWDVESMLNRIRSKAEGALFNNENFFLDVRRPDHYSASLVQWFLRVLDDGTVLANDIDGTRKLETVNEALETCVPLWEEALMKIFEKNQSKMKEAILKERGYWDETSDMLYTEKVKEFFEDEYGGYDEGSSDNHIMADIGNITINVFINEKEFSYHIEGLNGEEPIFDGEGFHQFKKDIDDIRFGHVVKPAMKNLVNRLKH